MNRPSKSPERAGHSNTASLPSPYSTAAAKSAAKSHLTISPVTSGFRKPVQRPKRPNGSPFLGCHRETAYYLLFNGILGDKRPAGGNVLTRPILQSLPAHAGPKIIFGEGCRLGPERLEQLGITFKQIPYQVKVG